MNDLKKELETRRKDFLNYFKKAKTINYLVLLGAIALFVGLFVLFHKLGQDTYGLISSIVVVIALFVYVNFTKKRVARYTNEYIKKYYEDTTKVLLDNVGIEIKEYVEENDITINKISDARIMKDVVYARSRNIVNTNIANKEVEIGDLMFKCQAPNNPKQTVVAFCGKFLQFQLDHEHEGRTLIYRKTKMENCYGPNDVDDLEKVIDDDYFLAYSSNKNFNKSSKELLKILKELEINDTLFDTTVSLTGNTATILLSYSDSVMVIPLYNETPIECFEKEAQDLKIIKSLIETL